jgi:hypothetical protein
MKNILFLIFSAFLVIANLGSINPVQAASPYDYRISAKSDDAVVNAGDLVILWVLLESTGEQQLDYNANYPLHLGTTMAQDRSSMLYTYDKWISPNRIRLTTRQDSIYEFGFTAQIPISTPTGTYQECFFPVLENLTWIKKTPICWNLFVTGQNNKYKAEIINDSGYVELSMKSNEEETIEFAVKNIGTETWNKSGSYPVHLATTYPHDYASDFYHPSWLNYNRPAELYEDYVVPGTIGHFKFIIKAPDSSPYTTLGDQYWLVAENLQWFQPPISMQPALSLAVNYHDTNNDNDDYDVNNSYDVPVLSLSYIPVKGNNKVDIDVMKDWKNTDLNQLRDYINESNQNLVKYLKKGSTYHGYQEASADPALDYQIVDSKEFLQELPKSSKFYWNNSTNHMIDYFEILENDVDICDYVDKDGVKEVWIWAYAAEDIEPVGWESNMMMGDNIEDDWNYSNYGNVSNSYRQKDMPICKNTYTAYTYNFGREVGMALEDHTHQIEAVMNYVDGRDDTASSDWDELLFWGKFVGSDSTMKTVNPGCGWTHYPPNTTKEYDWINTKEVYSDCADWQPDGSGDEKLVSCKTWGGADCDKYADDGEGVAYLVWWMQNIPGIDNDLYDKNNNKLKNWWDFIGDFDEHIGNMSLTY